MSGLQMRLVLLTLLLLHTACGGSGGAEPRTTPPPTVASVSLVPPPSSLLVGTTVNLAATALDAAGRTISGRTTVWASSDTLVLTVNSAGLAAAVTPGAADVSATIDARSATVRLVVTAVPVASVDVVAQAGAPQLELDTVRLTATPKTADGALVRTTVTWASGDTAVATVASDGLVAMRRRGTVEIRASATAGGRTVTGVLALQVGARPVATVVVEPSAFAIEAGLTRTLRVRALATSGAELLGRAFAFTSSVGGVAAVDAAGLVTGRSEGTTALTVTVDGTSATVSVTVTRRQAITRILDSIRVVYGVPALGAAIVTPGGIWAIDAVGLRKAGGTVAVTVNDKFHIGSNLKAVTGALIGRLVDRGLLRWDVTLAEVFPEHAATMRAEYRNVTLSDLLSHRSGMGPHVTVPFLQPSPREQRVAAVAWILSQAPGTLFGTFLYSGQGYVLAGAIAERVTNRAFEALVGEQLFAPLGAGSSVGFGAPSPTGSEIQPNGHMVLATGERIFANGDNPPVVSPGGTAHMSLPDWARYIREVLRGELGQTTVWQPETARRLTTIASPFGGGEGYAMGWMVLNRSYGNGKPVIWHNGSNNAHNSEATIITGRGFAVIVVTNQGPLVGTTLAEQAGRKAVETASARLISLYIDGR